MMLRTTIVLFASVAPLLALAGCEQDFGQPIPIACPPLDDPNQPLEEFSVVSQLIEKRCGTLDCHGSLYRPLRVYGKDGLRAFDDTEYNDPALAQANMTFAGGLPTTQDELNLTRQSICGLEPEKMQGVVVGDGSVNTVDPNDLLILQKPLGDLDCAGRADDGCVRHKGGQVFIGRGAADAICLKSWLTMAFAPFDDGACNEAIQVD